MNIKELKSKFDSLTSSMNKIIKLEARLIKKESKKEHIKALKPVKSNFKFQAESKSLMYLHRKNMHLRDTGTQTLEINRNNIFTQTDPMLQRCDKMSNIPVIIVELTKLMILVSMSIA